MTQQYEIIVSGIGTFYTDNEHAANCMLEWVEDFRSLYEPRGYFYDNEKFFDATIYKRSVTKEKVDEV